MDPDAHARSAAPDERSAADVVERHYAEWFVAEGVVPGVEVHVDRDLTWIVHPGHAWRNAGIMARFTPRTAERRLDAVLMRYRRHGRGMALWVSPSATPPHLSALLKARGLRCQRHFPAMLRQLDSQPAYLSPPTGVDIRRVLEVTAFQATPHPAIGKPTTALRRHSLERLRALISAPGGQTRAYVAWLGGQPVGAVELFLGSPSAGLHGLFVERLFGGRGIGSALIERVCQEARDVGAREIVLLATGKGRRLYAQRGFAEVAQFGYWYRAFGRG
jgi:GNAT superfamily N-acetyltransferase